MTAKFRSCIRCDNIFWIFVKIFAISEVILPRLHFQYSLCWRDHCHIPFYQFLLKRISICRTWHVHYKRPTLPKFHYGVDFIFYSRELFFHCLIFDVVIPPGRDILRPVQTTKFIFSNIWCFNLLTILGKILLLAIWEGCAVTLIVFKNVCLTFLQKPSLLVPFLRVCRWIRSPARGSEKSGSRQTNASGRHQFPIGNKVHAL